MPAPEFFREKAEQCRELLKAAVVPEAIDQLIAWVREFEEEAEKAEQGLASVAGQAKINEARVKIKAMRRQEPDSN